MKSLVPIWMTGLNVRLLLCVATAVWWAPPSGADDRIRVRIVSGYPSAQGSHPWMASLSYLGSDPYEGHLCGATIISSRHALTAAHCVADLPMLGLRLQITTGVSDLSSEGSTTTRVNAIAVHPSFDATASNHDLAVLVLDEPVSSPTIPLLSPDEASSERGGAVVTVIGWGTTSNDTEISAASLPRSLQEASLVVRNDHECSGRYGELFKRDSMLCADGYTLHSEEQSTPASCQGDSGGPLIVSTPHGVRQLGVVSWGTLPCRLKPYPDVFTRVSAHHGWVQGILQAPYGDDIPAVRGKPSVGHTVRCRPGAWRDVASEKLKYSWWSGSEKLARASSRASYRIRAADVTKMVHCTVTGENRFGATSTHSDLFGPIEPVFSQDLSAQSSLVRRVGAHCERSCTLFVETRRRVSQLRAEMSSAGCRGRTCRSSALRATGRYQEEQLWRFAFPKRAGIVRFAVYTKGERKKTQFSLKLGDGS